MSFTSDNPFTVEFAMQLEAERAQADNQVDGEELGEVQEEDPQLTEDLLRKENSE